MDVDTSAVIAILQKEPEAEIETVPFDAEQSRVAREGYRRFGKGSPPAGLDFGDCAAYALSRVSGEPLLFKGSGFARTDVAAAL